MKKIFITGGAGFIGINLVLKLVKDKENYVVIYDNLSREGVTKNLEYLQSLNLKNFEFIKGDIRDYKKLKEIVKNFDIIYHLAAQVAVTKSVENPFEDFEINAIGTLYLLETIRKNCPYTILIFSSTNKVYGELLHLKLKEGKKRYYLIDKKYGIDENENLDFHSPYGCSKGTADQYVRDYYRIYGLKSIV
ncbi:MAG: GDP-mannose 4,6-dehydratase, partial [Candidatus Omnitrophica bacterium]|nr:GDP-mannose 4,6-dehydratase [Candidatus Omnitrophota bacterium]